MSSIASITARRAFTARTALAPRRISAVRRFASAPPVKAAEESNLDKAPKRDPELYVRQLRRHLMLPRKQSFGY